MEEADGDYIEISPVQANKAFAMQQICRHFGIDAQHVLAFGDNENDMDMLRHAACPLPWAMRIGRYSKWLPW